MSQEKTRKFADKKISGSAAEVRKSVANAVKENSALVSVLKNPLTREVPHITVNTHVYAIKATCL